MKPATALVLALTSCGRCSCEPLVLSLGPQEDQAILRAESNGLPAAVLKVSESRHRARDDGLELEFRADTDGDGAWLRGLHVRLSLHQRAVGVAVVALGASHARGRYLRAGMTNEVELEVFEPRARVLRYAPQGASTHLDLKLRKARTRNVAGEQYAADFPAEISLHGVVESRPVD